MFLGHFGLGFGAKAAQPRPSLGTYFLAAQLADLLWPTLLLLGVEQVRIEPGITKTNAFDFIRFPFTHSLLTELLAGLALGLGYYLLRGRRAGAALVVGLLVPSHWLLDLLVHRPDLPLYPGPSPLLGLGWWNHPLLAQELEFLLLGVGLWLYVRHTQARDRQGRYGLVALVALLVLAHLGSLLSPPPASVPALAWGGQAMWLFVALAYWADRHRAPRQRPQPGTAGETAPAFGPSSA